MELQLPSQPSALVGIGASAGGLEAIGELFSHLPPETGMAFLLVQHLQPGHPSMLSSIVGTKTSMPVAEATEGATIEPNRVYVIPPNAVMRVAEHRIRLGPRKDALGPPMPVDDLLESLAQDDGLKPIGVILSGSGSDGALGMQRIKQAGGLTFAQDEASARFNGMPGAAIGLGCVDRVLPPARIAEELARIGRHSYVRAAAPAPEPSSGEEEALTKLFALLRNVSGVDFTHYKRGTLHRRLARRLALQNLPALQEYLPMLEQDSAEAEALCQDLLIRVTSFFRDPEAFAQLTQVVFPRLLENHPLNRTIRVWVPGCASGEELYSVAMCLLDFLRGRGATAQVQLFGTDVSDAALRVARAGVYVENIAREVPEERLQRFFVKEDGSYRISKAVRDLCVFANHDLTRDPPFSRIDLISCRNVLIYFDALLQKRVMPLFHYALNASGVLMLGSAESVGQHSDLFGVLDARCKIYVKKPIGGRAPLEMFDPRTPPVPPPRSASIETAEPLSERASLMRAVQRVVLDRYAAGAVVCDETLDIVEFLGDTGPYLAHPSGTPRLNLRHMARPGLLAQLSLAIERAHATGHPVRERDIRVEADGKVRRVDVEVIPLQSATIKGRWCLICFEEVGTPALRTASEATPAWWSRLRTALRGRATDLLPETKQESGDAELAYLRRELVALRELNSSSDDAQGVLRDELRATQEELVSSNEEFRSTNEELQTAKEELQSANEELATTNDELRHRNRELSELNAQATEARDYAQAIVRTIREPLLVLDRALRIVQANPAYYASFNATPALTEQGLLFEVGRAQWDIAELRAHMQRILAEETSFEGLQLSGTFGAGSNKVLRLNGRRLVWADHILILLAIEDVTERVAALDALKEQEQRKDEFLAMLAHELRNPLSPMLAVLELWKRGFPDAESEKNGRAVLQRQVQQQIRLVDDLLDVARITSGRIELQRAAVDLRAIVSDCVEDRRDVLDDRRRQLSITLPPAALWVNGDATRLAQVVSNLLGNAIKYTHPGGHIGIVLSQEGATALLKIADDGIGITPELLPTIFDLFVQEKRAPDRAQGGLGLGLTLVRRIVELHGGTVEAHSAGANRGSEFILRLPASSLPALTPSPPPTVSAPTPGVGTRRILVVDDNVDAAATLAMLLELHGHQVKVAHTALEGLQLAATFQPQVVLLDIGLPEMDGYELARRMRSLPATRTALLIALSGYGRTEDRQRADQAGFDHHVVKPASVDQLVALIAPRHADTD